MKVAIVLQTNSKEVMEMKVMIDLMKAMMHMPTPWQAWLGVSVMANMLKHEVGILATHRKGEIT